MIYALCGGIVILYQTFIKHNTTLKISKYILSLVIILIFISTWSLIVTLFNQTNDYEFVKFSFSIILMLIASYFVAKCTYSIKKNISEEIVAEFIIYAVLLQNIISLFMFIDPSIDTFLRGLLSYDTSVENVILDTKGFRINGFGINFFGAGIINAFTIIIISNRIVSSVEKKQLLYIIFFISITLMGSMVSRTTIIGTVLGILLMIFSKQKSEYKIFFNLSISIMIISICSFALYKFSSSETQMMIDNVSKFGFEFIYNYKESGKLTTASTESLKDMYIFPSELKTYFIGDGYFRNPQNPNYFYKDTDVGYLRMIYYFGILGLILFIIYEYILYHKLAISSTNRNLYMNLFLLTLILNFKGMTDFSYLPFIFYFSIIYNNTNSVLRNDGVIQH
jgi:hypothetical protein